MHTFCKFTTKKQAKNRMKWQYTISKCEKNVAGKEESIAVLYGRLL